MISEDILIPQSLSRVVHYKKFKPVLDDIVLRNEDPIRGACEVINRVVKNTYTKTHPYKDDLNLVITMSEDPHISERASLFYSDAYSVSSRILVTGGEEKRVAIEASVRRLGLPDGINAFRDSLLEFGRVPLVENPHYEHLVNLFHTNVFANENYERFLSLSIEFSKINEALTFCAFEEKLLLIGGVTIFVKTYVSMQQVGSFKGFLIKIHQDLFISKIFRVPKVIYNQIYAHKITAFGGVITTAVLFEGGRYLTTGVSTFFRVNSPLYTFFYGTVKSSVFLGFLKNIMSLGGKHLSGFLSYFPNFSDLKKVK